MGGIEDLIGGALLGAIMGELLKAVLHAKAKDSEFQAMFERLGSTLNSIIPLLDEISRLNYKLDIQQRSINNLKVIVKNGKSLVEMCPQIPRYNLRRKSWYRKELSKLDISLKTSFTTTLPLELFKNNLEMMKLMKELHMNLVGTSEGAKHMEALGRRVQEDSDQKEESDMNQSFNQPETKMYQAKAGKKLFLLNGCPYQDLDQEDLRICELVRDGTYATSYKCSTKYGDFLMKSINLDLKMRESEFEQRMEDIGKVGQHPNILLPFGYLFSEISKFLLYDYVPAHSFYDILTDNVTASKRLGTRAYWNRSLKIILGTAKGISHIHSEGGVVHGNIKSSNVLVTPEFDGRISDFGLAPMMNSPELGAPELKVCRKATQKSDVYNFGVMLIEIKRQCDWHLAWHPNILKEWFEIGRIASKCMDEDPERRPKMVEVVRLIQNIRPSDKKILPMS